LEQHIKLKKFYHHPIETVWTAISDAEAISKWFIEAEFQAEVGFNYTFRHESTTVTGEVLAVEPPTLLIYTWQVGDMAVRTTVRWQLSGQRRGTLLELEHWGFEAYEQSALEMFEASVKGWDAVTAELERYLEQSVHERPN